MSASSRNNFTGKKRNLNMKYKVFGKNSYGKSSSLEAS